MADDRHFIAVKRRTTDFRYWLTVWHSLSIRQHTRLTVSAYSLFYAPLLTPVTVKIAPGVPIYFVLPQAGHAGRPRNSMCMHMK